MDLKLVVAVPLLAGANVGKVKERLLEEEDIYEVVGRTIFTNPEFDKARKEATAELLQILGKLILDNPTQRFGQILQNYGFVSFYDESDPYAWNNEFYLEPVELLKRVQEKLNIEKA